MPENPFAERYRNHTNSALFKIINNPGAYETLAVEAAQNELLKRDLSEEELNELKEKMAKDELQKTIDREKYVALGNNIKGKANAVLDSLNPIQKETPSAEKQLNIFCIYLTGIFLYNLYASYQTLFFILSEPFKLEPLEYFFLSPLFVLPIVIFLLWKRKKVGWFSILVLLTFIVTALLFTIYYFLFIVKRSGFPMIDNYLKPPLLLDYVLPLIFYGSGIYFLCRKNILEIFKIERKNISRTILIGFLLTVAVFVYIGKQIH